MSISHHVFPPTSQIRVVGLTLGCSEHSLFSLLADDHLYSVFDRTGEVRGQGRKGDDWGGEKWGKEDGTVLKRKRGEGRGDKESGKEGGRLSIFCCPSLRPEEQHDFSLL